MATPEGHAKDDLDELIVDIAILIAEELDLTHRLVGHHQPVEGCERCERVTAVPQALVSDQHRGRFRLTTNDKSTAGLGGRPLPLGR